MRAYNTSIAKLITRGRTPAKTASAEGRCSRSVGGKWLITEDGPRSKSIGQICCHETCTTPPTKSRDARWRRAGAHDVIRTLTQKYMIAGNLGEVPWVVL